jgi:hypothetical protein
MGPKAVSKSTTRDTVDVASKINAFFISLPDITGPWIAM